MFDLNQDHMLDRTELMRAVRHACGFQLYKTQAEDDEAEWTLVEHLMYAVGDENKDGCLDLDEINKARARLLSGHS